MHRHCRFYMLYYKVKEGDGKMRLHKEPVILGVSIIVLIFIGLWIVFRPTSTSKTVDGVQPKMIQTTSTYTLTEKETTRDEISSESSSE